MLSPRAVSSRRLVVVVRLEVSRSKWVISAVMVLHIWDLQL